jgi:hypothetical protein
MLFLPHKILEGDNSSSSTYKEIEMELKFKEVGKEYSIESNNIKIRPYLMIEEINDIVNQCLTTNNQVERELIKVCKTIEYCTNIDLGKGDIQGEEVYNMICELGIVENIKIDVNNYYIVDECIENSESTFVAMNGILNVINNKLNELEKEVSAEKTQEFLSKIKEVVK